MMKGLEEKLNVKFPDNLESEEAVKMMDDLCKKYEVVCTYPRTPSRMIDKVIFKFKYIFA